LTEKRQKLSVIHNRVIWADGFKKLGGVGRKALMIAIFGLFLPQVLLALYLDARSINVASQIIQITESLENSAGPQSFALLVATIAGFAVPLIGSNILILLIIMASYFALSALAVTTYRGLPAPSTMDSLSTGIKAIFPRGLMLLVWMIVVLMFGQFLVFPLVIVGSLSLVVPILMMAEKKSASRALLDAVMLRYVKRTTYGPWNVFFSLMTLAAIVYGLLLLISVGGDGLLRLDEHFALSRDFWVLTAIGESATWAYVLTMIVQTVAATAVLTILPFLTTGFYFVVASPDFRESV